MPSTAKSYQGLLKTDDQSRISLYIRTIHPNAVPCGIAKTLSGAGSDVTLVWRLAIARVEFLPARLIYVSSSIGINLLTTSFSSSRYCAHIFGIGKLIAAGITSAVSSAISKNSSCMMQLPEAVGEYYISSASCFFTVF